MCVEERRLLGKIRYLEDMLLRSKDRWQQESISKDLSIMRIRLQKLQQNYTIFRKQIVILMSWKN